MTEVEVLVRLAAADPWSFTVLDTLKRKERLEAITAVTRIKAWRLGFDVRDRSAARAAVDGLLKETALLANPNRDRWCVREVARRAQPQNLWRRQKGSADAFVIKVTDLEDQAGDGLLKVLKFRLGVRGIQDAAFAHLWVIETDVDEPDSRAIAGEVAVSKAWRHGLLSNPHFQCAEVMKAETYLPFHEVARSEVSA